MKCFRGLMAGVAIGTVATIASAQAQRSPFDGVWAATVACSAVDDAAGYTLRFPVRIAGGDLTGENGSPGAPGYLRLSGRVQADGSALLSAEGLVGSPRVAIGHVASLTPYRYTAPTRFSADHGSGNRNTTRPCTLEFVRGR